MIFFIGSITAMIVFGVFAARFPIRFRAMAGGTSLLLGLGLMAFAPTFVLYCVGAALMGLGYGNLNVLFNSLFSKSYGDKTPQMMSLINGFWGIGAMLGPLLVRAVQPRFEQAFGALAVLTVLCGIASFLMPLADHEESVKDTTDVSAGVRFAFMAMFFMYVACETSSVQLISSYGVSHLQWDKAYAATIGSAFWLGLTVGRFVASALSKVVQVKHWVLVCALGVTASTALTFSGSTAAIGFGLFGLFCGPFFPNALSWFRFQLGASTASMSWTVVGASFGAAIGPKLTQTLPAGIPAGNLGWCILFIVATLATFAVVAKSAPRIS